MTSLIDYQCNDGVGIVRLNRPEALNAINISMFKQLAGLLRRLKKDRALRVLIVCGEGENFCSGLDIKSVMGNKKQTLALLWKWRLGSSNLAQSICQGLREIAVPVIAVLQGRVWGAGAQLALGADFRIASPETELALMEGRWGLIPDMAGTIALRVNMPLDQAMLYAMRATPVDAKTALAAHLLTEINDTPMARALALAEELVERSPDMLAAVKKHYYHSYCPNKRQILGRETLWQWRVLMGKNIWQAIKAQKKQLKAKFSPRKIL